MREPHFYSRRGLSCDGRNTGGNSAFEKPKLNSVTSLVLFRSDTQFQQGESSSCFLNAVLFTSACLPHCITSPDSDQHAGVPKALTQRFGKTACSPLRTRFGEARTDEKFLEAGWVRRTFCSLSVSFNPPKCHCFCFHMFYSGV